MTMYVLFTESALCYMYTHAQRRWMQKEAGGELYSSTPHSLRIVVDAVAGPHQEDYRTRHSYNPNLKSTDNARLEMYARGRHAIGLWHTHPERSPRPSGQDKKTTEEYLRAFGNDRDRYLSIIIGNRGDLLEIAVWSAEKNGDWLSWNEFHGQVQDQIP
ncbi:Mov34/MPN/PAD-1 family protein [Oxalicibacterium faecigallinarum]